MWHHDMLTLIMDSGCGIMTYQYEFQQQIQQRQQASWQMMNSHIMLWMWTLHWSNSLILFTSVENVINTGCHIVEHYINIGCYTVEHYINIGFQTVEHYRTWQSMLSEINRAHVFSTEFTWQSQVQDMPDWTIEKCCRHTYLCSKIQQI